jgi:hypothetical protein
MEFVTQLSIICGLTLTVIGIGTLIYRSGKHNQYVVGSLEELKKDIDLLNELKNENKSRIEKVFELINHHLNNTNLHVNAPLEAQIQREYREQLIRIEKRLESLIK